MGRRKATQAPPDYASRYPGAQEVKGDGEWMEWTEEGQECVGVYRGSVPFRNGIKTTMVTDDGVVVFSTPKLLQAKLQAVEIGQWIAIVYVGEGKDTGKGNPLKEFQVFIQPDSA